MSFFHIDSYYLSLDVVCCKQSRGLSKLLVMGKHFTNPVRCFITKDDPGDSKLKYG